MQRFRLVVCAFVLLIAGPARAAEVGPLLEEFQRQTGARLVFDPADLPAGRYHDIMPSLSPAGQEQAARIAVRELQKLPPGYLKAIGLKAVGIFAACASREGDGYRPYDDKLKGYRYYGIWNGKDGVAGAFYTEQQLPLTLHHEIFHHVDATLAGRTDPVRGRRDERFQDAIHGRNPYPAAALAEDDLAALRRVARGRVLEGAVSEYAKKSIAEDKAETARYLMTNLADALVQVATRPELPGSQRMLHVLHRYGEAPAENGPSLAWFVSVALGRAEARRSPAPVAPSPAAPPTPAEIAARLKELARPGQPHPAEAAEAALRQAEELNREALPKDEAAAVVRAVVRLADEVLHQHIQAKDGDRGFGVRGKEDAQGVNWTLRQDLAEVGRTAQRLHKIAALAPDEGAAVAAEQLRSLRLLARYYLFIAGRWRVTDGTRQAFEAARDEIVAALPADQAAAVKARTGLVWERLAQGIASDGSLPVIAPRADTPAPAPAPVANEYVAKVDAAIADAEARAAIRRVQPACVRLNTASGVNLAPEGVILTASHCVRGLGSTAKVEFPDGRAFTATCTAFDAHLDLAVCTIAGAKGLPFAPLAALPAEVGDWVACIGQPGTRTPGGSPTGYKPFHVSVGQIRGFMPDLLGSQALGRAKHDAWTYWGHSGSPLFNKQGQLVALHNSWDSKTALRHAVPYQAILHFLRAEKVPFTLAEAR